MMCVTGAETTLAAVADRIAGGGEDVALHEVRADHLEHIDDDLFDLLDREGARILFCCRTRAQGGNFDGTETERRMLLHRAKKARWIDVEHDVPLDQFELERVVLSWHDFNDATDVVRQARALGQRGVGIVKLAARIDDAAEIATLMEARETIAGKAIVIGMGPAGVLTRVRYRALGSEWTYIAATSDHATAPGQIDLPTARVMGLPATGAAPFCALIGGPQIFASPGPRTYNALYRSLRLEMSYLPIITTSLSRCLPVLERLGAVGLSATMPLKLEALGLCKPDALAHDVASVNSLRHTATGWEGTNTDIEGVRAPLAAAGAQGTALVLGAGGAARAAVSACRSLGLRVTVSARSPRELRDVVPWKARTRVAHDVLINATPICGTQSPWPDDIPLAGCVFDLAIATHSALLRRAKREGRVAIDAQTMWLHQGAQQMSWMLGVPLSPQQLEEHLS